MKRTSVGLDVGASTCHIAALDSEGRSVRHLQVPTSEAKLVVFQFGSSFALCITAEFNAIHI
jgi:hypothetical protein